MATRRSILKSLATLPALGGTLASVAPQTPPRTLTVVMHGLWVIHWVNPTMTEKGFLLALAPDVGAEHTYRLGRLDSLLPARKWGSYSLSGVSGEDYQRPDPNCFPVVTESKIEIDKDDAYYTVMLPLPHRIKGFCSVKKDPDKGEFFLGSKAPKPNRVSTVLALIYDLAGKDKPTLFPTNWSAQPTGRSFLHLRAEPLDDHSDHFGKSRDVLNMSWWDLRFNGKYAHEKPSDPSDDEECPADHQKHEPEPSSLEKKAEFLIRPVNCHALFATDGAISVAPSGKKS